MSQCSSNTVLGLVFSIVVHANSGSLQPMHLEVPILTVQLL